MQHFGSWTLSWSVAFSDGSPDRRTTVRSLESISKLNNSLKSFRMAELI